MFEHITHLPSLFSRDGLIPLRVLVSVSLLVIEADTNETALDDSGDVFEDDVLMVSLEDLEEGPLGDLAPVFEQFIGQLKDVDKETAVLSVPLLDYSCNKLCSPVLYHQGLMLVECSIALLYVVACRRKSAGEEGYEEGL